jgi:S-DNA-T family DNA segregation ATPase FtsK/SpoIIIE
VLARLVPLVLLACAWHVLRHAEKPAPAGRLAIGWVALGAGVVGIVHVRRVRPSR